MGEQASLEFDLTFGDVLLHKIVQAYDLQPELGSGLPGRWRLRPTLPGSRVTRRAWRLSTLCCKNTLCNMHLV